MFTAGDRVLTSKGLGEVVYRRMQPPDYREAVVYSVRLDGQEQERGTVFGAAEVQAAPALAVKPPERKAPVPLVFEQAATIYHRGDFGFAYHRIEVRTVAVVAQKWAQYERALAVSFIEKGKRKARGFVEMYRPELVILSGWGHPTPADPFRDLGGGHSVSRASSHDESWGLEFEALIRPVIEASPDVLLGDYRGFDTQGR
jgi:hypothetical protein